MFDSIVVPLDGSHFAERALPVALGIARRHGASIRLVLVHVPVAATYIDAVPHFNVPADAELREHERRYLDAVTERLSSESGISVSAELLDGPVAAVLEGYARETGADLIVMSTHGRGGLSRVWLGSVADALVRRATTPVLLVRPDEDRESDEPQAFRNVLVPLDGSPLAEEALGYALAMARREGARCTLLRAVVPVTVVGSPYIGSSVNVAREDLEARTGRATTYLDRVAERLRKDSVEVATQVVVHGQPAAAILEAAGRTGADLIVMSTHGRSGVSRLLLGSVSDKVARGATGPVLLCRPTD